MAAGPGDAQEDNEVHINAAAIAAYYASIQSGAPLSERKPAQMFGKTSAAGHATAWTKPGKHHRKPWPTPPPDADAKVHAGRGRPWPSALTDFSRWSRGQPGTYTPGQAGPSPAQAPVTGSHTADATAPVSTGSANETTAAIAPA